MIIGIVGSIGSGKDTAAEYLEKTRGYRLVSFRDIVRETVEEMGFEPSRDNMQKISRQCRDKYGEDYFSRKVVEKGISLLNRGHHVLFKEMRTSVDIEPLIKHFGKKLHIIMIDADEKIRFSRLRARKRLGDPETFEGFLLQQQREKELHYTDSFKFAAITITNNGTAEELYEKLDRIVGDLK